MKNEASNDQNLEAEKQQNLINKLSDKLFDVKDSDSNLSEKKSSPLIEHAYFHFDFKDKKITLFDVIRFYFNKEKYDSNCPYFSIITNIEQLSADKLKITKKQFFKEYINDQPSLGNETIIVSRGIEKSSYMSLVDNQFKKEATFLTNDLFLTKSVRFKLFSDVKELLFFQNIFYYKSLTELKHFFKSFSSDNNNNSPKIDFEINKSAYHDILNNFI